MQLLARRRRFPSPADGRPGNHTQQRADRELLRTASHGPSCSQAHRSISSSRRLPPFPRRTSTRSAVGARGDRRAWSQASGDGRRRPAARTTGARQPTKRGPGLRGDPPTGQRSSISVVPVRHCARSTHRNERTDPRHHRSDRCPSRHFATHVRRSLDGRDRRARPHARPGVQYKARTPEGFAQVTVDPETGTVVWPGGADLAPDTLYVRARTGAWPGQRIAA